MDLASGALTNPNPAAQTEDTALAIHYRRYRNPLSLVSVEGTTVGTTNSKTVVLVIVIPGATSGTSSYPSYRAERT